jgi:hypothetical protein
MASPDGEVNRAAADVCGGAEEAGRLGDEEFGGKGSIVMTSQRQPRIRRCAGNICAVGYSVKGRRSSGHIDDFFFGALGTSTVLLGSEAKERDSPTGHQRV